MMSPDLPNQMQAEPVPIGEQERLTRRVAREWRRPGAGPAGRSAAAGRPALRGITQRHFLKRAQRPFLRGH
jgi:hypothetical protein